MKGILLQLQGFANHCISKYRHHEFTSSTVLNHLGFVIQEHLIQFYHNFDTVVPRKKPTHCGLCDGMDHNARSCSMQCPICEKGYYVGHTKAKCEKATAGNDSLCLIFKAIWQMQYKIFYHKIKSLYYSNESDNLLEAKSPLGSK